MNRMAWRNIWRVPRRTVTVLLAVVTGLWAMVALSSVMAGALDQMVRNGIKNLTGHIQIHRKGYHADPVIENSMAEDAAVLAVLEGYGSRLRWARRVRVPAVVSTARHSVGLTLVGIEPVQESRVSFIGSAVVEGRYLEAGDERGILLGRKVADRLGARVGGKVVLLSQDSQKDIASAAFRIQGFFAAEPESVEEQFAFVLLGSAQSMLKLGASISEIAVVAEDHDRSERLRDEIAARLEASLEVLHWKELLPLVTSTIALWKGFVSIWYGIAFIAIAFSLVNTMLMAVLERSREFGMLKALGMKPRRIVSLILTESFWLIFTGLAVGNVVSVGTVLWVARSGIDLTAFVEGTVRVGLSRVVYPTISVEEWVAANFMVLIPGLLVNLYPAMKAARITPVVALRQS